jgi:hypothetical protein
MKKLTLLLLIPLISGCSVLSLFKKEPEVKPVEIQTKAVERTRLNIKEPTPLSGKPMQWVVITPENAEEVWKRLKEENTDQVLFGLTDDGYEQLAITMAEIRNFIAQQRIIILKYKEYYEPEITDSK